MEKAWRLIIDGAREPAMNMAIDEAMMVKVCDGSSMPALRIYKWLNPCVSVGKFQRYKSAAGTEVVRRPTGGGSVPHGASGMTYSLVYREGQQGISKGAAASYRQIHGCVAAALASLGIDARLLGAESAHAKPFGECFSSPVPADVMVGGRKVAGAAQRRKNGAVLHQGEISLDLDVSGKWSYNYVQTAFINCLSEQLDLKFLETRVSEEEEGLAKELVMVRNEEVTK
ncbi:MAG: lipoate--protein ligase family protein [Candidatus Omnitrophica bacterium]|nr:lipoate--protein ligase family protein [Candidatus Omnitrophota bacterium]MDD5737163.1 lipoate--protein ligase family protein [Candidatus Omnitrophota bacterium]